jgi:hypothetical protein
LPWEDSLSFFPSGEHRSGTRTLLVLSFETPPSDQWTRPQGARIAKLSAPQQLPAVW